MMNVAIISEPSDALASGAGIANVILATAALAVAIISIYFTRSALRAQIRHNKLSVRPIPYIALSKHDGIAICLQNHGFGPFQIDVFEIVRSGVVLENMVQILPENPPPGVVVTYTTGMFERTVPENESIELVRVLIKDVSHDALSYLGQVKLNIARTVVKIGYSDIYGDLFDEYQKELDWLCKD